MTRKMNESFPRFVAYLISSFKEKKRWGFLIKLSSIACSRAAIETSNTEYARENKDFTNSITVYYYAAGCRLGCHATFGGCSWAQSEK